ncbi:MAG: hypothetical protein OQK09_08180 [Colwellia sp.]|nr:hypothetical protein [Colwellia sp.]MCW9081477.1 hypothetical protein [Colwellia sp.]
MCSCKDYFPEVTDASSFEQENITEKYYLSHGSSFCSGLKQFDTSRADKSARANLSRMINAQIQSSQQNYSASFGYGTTSEKFVEQTNIKSELSLESAYIYKRWVDVKYCTIYSAIRMDVEKAEAAAEKQHQKEQTKLINQIFYIEPNTHVEIKSHLKNILSERGIKLAQSKSASDVILNTKVENVQYLRRKLVKLILSISIENKYTGNLVWQHSAKGKGLSFQHKEKPYLVEKALSDALDRLSPYILEALHDENIAVEHQKP